MKPVSRQYLRLFHNTCRKYATQVAGKRAEGKPVLAAQDAKVSKLPNGVPIASLENYSPMCRIAVVFNAGPRYEPIDKLGLTHCLRVACNLRSEKSTAFAIARNLQQLGATLSCTTTREHMIYSMECLRQDVDLCAELLGQVALAPSFKVWELSDIERLQRVDVALFNQRPHNRLMELIHKAAFRDTLGRSLCMAGNRLGSFTAENLEEYVSTQYVSGNMAVAGVGVDHDTLAELVKKMPVREGPQPAVMQKAKYHGGEERADIRSPLVHAGIVTEGVASTSDELLSVALVSQVLGAHPGVEYSPTQPSSKLYSAASSAVSDRNFALTSIYSSYSDSGLFGVQGVTTAQNIGALLKSIVSVMRQVMKAGITDADLKRAKQQLKLSLHLDAEDASQLVQSMAVDVLASGKVNLPSSIEKDLDAVTLESVNAVAKRIIGGRPSLAVIGDLLQTPHLDQLI